MGTADDRFYSHMNFGPRKKGLATVGYTVKNPLDDSVIVARSTSVIEYTVSGNPTGIYAAIFMIANPKQEVAVVWDTGETKPEYGIDHNASRWYRVEHNTVDVPLIKNSIRNRNDFEAKVLRELANRTGVEFTEDVRRQIGTVFSDVLKENKLTDLNFPDMPRIDIGPVEAGITKIHEDIGQLETVLTKKMGLNSGRAEMKAMKERIAEISKIVAKEPKDNTEPLIAELRAMEERLGKDTFKETVISMQTELRQELAMTAGKGEVSLATEKIKMLEKQLTELKDQLSSVHLDLGIKADTLQSSVAILLEDLTKIGKVLLKASGKSLKVMLEKLTFITNLHTILLKSKSVVKNARNPALERLLETNESANALSTGLRLISAKLRKFK